MMAGQDTWRAAGRNRYADLLRVAAIAGVVLGHWLLVSITYGNGRLSGRDALLYVSWGRWVTWLFQVMPVFFLVGGYANAVSWAAHHQQGLTWTAWVRRRAMRLLWPATGYVTVAALAAAGARAAGVPAGELAEAGWLAGLHLWFLPVYLLLIALTPALLAAHRRWGLAVPAVMAAGAAAVDVGSVGCRLPLIGFVNYLMVWGSIHQWGFAWQDATLTRARWRPWALAAGGGGALAGLLAWGPFPVDMIGAGERIGNTTPPSVALLAFAAAQAGLLLAAEPALTRLLARPAWWRQVSRLNPLVMNTYLWHMAPVIVIAVAFYPTGVMPQPSVGTPLWWALRPAWFALLAAVLVPLVLGITRAERPLARLPAGVGPAGPWSPVLLAGGLAAASAALARIAIAGFAPGGHAPVSVLAAYAGGVLLAFASGRAGAGRSRRAPVPPPRAPIPPPRAGVVGAGPAPPRRSGRPPVASREGKEGP